MMKIFAAENGYHKNVVKDQSVIARKKKGNLLNKLTGVGFNYI